MKALRVYFRTVAPDGAYALHATGEIVLGPARTPADQHVVDEGIEANLCAFARGESLRVPKPGQIGVDLGIPFHSVIGWEIEE